MSKQLYMIGNAHLDPVWLWPWQDGYAAARATFRSALDRMNEYPDFIFTTAAVCYYEWIEHSDPDMFEEIKRRVSEGRWRIVGGWWIQADCNIPSGESFARQALIAQSYLKDKLGFRTRTGYNVDSFGHSGTLPSILKLSGIDRYVYMRPMNHEKQYPAYTFKWQGLSGNEVTAYHIPGSYNTNPDEIAKHMEYCLNEIKDGNGLMCFYGVGNHGGGPTKRNIESIIAFNEANGESAKFSHPDEFFDNASGDLPVVQGDLFHHASGCYSAHSQIKRLNRKAENALLTAEKLSYMAKTEGARDRSNELEAAWKKLLFNQFHDVLAGTCIKEAYVSAQNDLGYALSAAEDISNEALQYLSGLTEVPFIEGAYPFVAFNPHSFEAQWHMEIETEDFGDNYELINSRGEKVPYQKLPASAAVIGRAKLSFTAKLPALGIERFMLIPAAKTHEKPTNIDDFRLENEFLCAKLNPETGELKSLMLKSNSAELINGECSIRCFKDDSDTWSHAKFKFDGECDKVELLSIKITENSAYMRSIKTVQRVSDSLITRTYTVYSDLPYLFTHVKIDWRETQKCLKLACPLNLDSPVLSVQEPFGYAERPFNGEEFPMQQWIMAKDGSSALAILNDGKYSYDAHDNTLSITALRSPYYAHHVPKVVDSETEDYPVTDWGMQEFELVYMPIEGGSDNGDLEKAALLINQPPIVQSEYAHAGRLGAKTSFAKIEGCASIEALKSANDMSGDMIIHLRDIGGKGGQATVSLIKFDAQIALEFYPNEIKALSFSPKSGKFKRVSLIEEEL